MKAKIKEIFSSVQGEGVYVGYKQLFVRFCKCNLNCAYCDTDFMAENAREYTPKELAEYCNKYTDCHSVSLTGGEPLMETEFLKEFIPLLKLPVYLETNATLYKEAEEIMPFVEYVAADIKLPSATGLPPRWNEHDKFFKTSMNKKLFAKVVFDSNIADEEVRNATQICKKYGVELIIQPMMKGSNPAVSSEFMIETLNRFIKYYDKVRLIPQVHKFINVD